MESSSVLAFRIFVMLSCLVIVPLAAIFGSAFPDLVKTVLVDRIVAWSTGRSPQASGPGGFVAVTPEASNPSAAAQGEAPRWGQNAPAAAWHVEPAAQNQGVVPAAAVNPGTGNQPANFATAADPNRVGVYGQERGLGESAPHAAVQDGSIERPAVNQSNPAHPSQDPRVEGSRGAAQPERFTAMERKLREFGATYYLLETWGNEGELYRFHCKMAIGNNPNYTRHFEATDRDALKAMAQVLEKVEMWREGRLQ
jgi:hypothetical protein